MFDVQVVFQGLPVNTGPVTVVRTVRESGTEKGRVEYKVSQWHAYQQHAAVLLLLKVSATSVATGEGLARSPAVQMPRGSVDHCRPGGTRP